VQTNFIYEILPPALLSISKTGRNQTTITGTLSGFAATYQIQFFLVPASERLAGNQGKTLLYTLGVTKRTDRTEPFTAQIPALIPADQAVTATTTEIGSSGSPGGTSLFSTFAGVPAAPCITLLPMNQTPATGNTAHFTAAVSGTPMPTVQWQAENRSGIFADITDNPSATTDTLTLTGVTPALSSNYRAVFTNSYGSVTTFPIAQLYVRDGPIVTVQSPASASVAVIAGNSTTLSVLGADLYDESSLTYSWSVVRAPGGAKSPVFSDNGTNAAKSIAFTAAKDGGYRLRCTIADGSGNSATTDVSIRVQQVPTSLRLSPHAQTIRSNSRVRYRAIAYDQFRHALRTQPVVHYSILQGPGTIGAHSGVFIASGTRGFVLIEASDDLLSAMVGARII
jgi:hypothetical protein